MTTEHSPNGIAEAREDLLAKLIREAGPRETPPPAIRAAVFAAAQKTWQAGLARRRRQNHYRLAAGLTALAIVAAMYSLDRPAPDAQVATIERVIGLLETRPAVDMPWQTVDEGLRGLNRGGHLRTLAGSRAGVTLAGGESLRLAGNTELVILSPTRIELRSGKLYLDSGPDSRGGVTVVTPAGIAREVGTQFEVRYAQDNYRLRIREGRVRLRRDGDELVGDAGEQLNISATGEVAIARIAADDPDWQWVQEVAPAPRIDNQPLSLLLDWVARETGRPVVYQRPALRDRAETTVLHGNIRHLAPMQALGVVLATTDFDYDKTAEGAIMIRLRSD